MYSVKILNADRSGFTILAEPLSFYVEKTASKCGFSIVKENPKKGRVIILRDDTPLLPKRVLKNAVNTAKCEVCAVEGDLFFIIDTFIYNEISGTLNETFSFADFAERVNEKQNIQTLKLADLGIKNSGKYIVRTSSELERASRKIKARINKKLAEKGVFFFDSKNSYVGPRVKIAKGCHVLQGVTITGKTTIGEGSVIGPYTELSDMRIGERVTVKHAVCSSSKIGDDTTVGPFAYIRPGCDIGEHVKIGDFVEVKNAVIGNHTKASHLTYIGDADLGERINMGCGTITANYDGKNKARTIIEDDVFVGSNSNLIAPVTVKKGAFVAAGSTITDEVPEEALAIARARQVVKPEWNRRD